MMRASNRRRRDAGAAAVEMALVLPLLVLCCFAVIDLGRLLFTSIALEGAAQEGSMYASFVPDDDAAVRQRVVESLESPALDPSDVTVVCPGSDEIRVEVRHDVELLTPVVGEWFGGTITLTRDVTGHIFSGAACDPSGP
jgi:Flp pilus assembly protein TadG